MVRVQVERRRGIISKEMQEKWSKGTKRVQRKNKARRDGFLVVEDERAGRR
jgi:hypothetical protein